MQSREKKWVTIEELGIGDPVVGWQDANIAIATYAEGWIEDVSEDSIVIGKSGVEVTELHVSPQCRFAVELNDQEFQNKHRAGATEIFQALHRVVGRPIGEEIENPGFDTDLFESALKLEREGLRVVGVTVSVPPKEVKLHDNYPHEEYIMAVCCERDDHNLQNCWFYILFRSYRYIMSNYIIRDGLAYLDEL